MHYCDYTATLPPDNPHRRYHDHEYGYPIAEDDRLFERLVFEINQAGLSWTTILNKADNLRRAYDHFAIARVAAYGEADIARLTISILRALPPTVRPTSPACSQTPASSVTAAK